MKSSGLFLSSLDTNLVREVRLSTQDLKEISAQPRPESEFPSHWVKFFPVLQGHV
jgi:hypothetical protein